MLPVSAERIRGVAAPATRERSKKRVVRAVVVGAERTDKRPFDIPEMMRRLRVATKPYPKAAMFELYDEGYTSAFEILAACIISIRTLEEVTLPTSRALFAVARTPAEIARLTPKQIDALLRTCTFHGPKAKTIHDIAKRSVAEFGGSIPCDFDVLTSFRGVGPKCANLVLGIACHHAHGIAVDIHVHRVTNRWGYVHARTPEQTMAQLEQKLPRRYWVEINKLLVPFGKYVCTGTLPKCSTCPLLSYCRQVGVTKHR
jgi:endonuclease-3